jgi:two-component sensor histidine kinase
VKVTSLTEAEGRQRVLVAELQYRTRNLLNVVQALVMQTLGKAGTKELKERLTALGRVQSLVSRSDGEPIDLAEVIRLELRAYAAGQDGRVNGRSGFFNSIDAMRTSSQSWHVAIGPAHRSHDTAGGRADGDERRR